MKVLVAGATGAIGRPLIRLLKESGHAVFGLARSSDAERALVEMGAEAVNGDALDAASVKRDSTDSTGCHHQRVNLAAQTLHAGRNEGGGGS